MNSKYIDDESRLSDAEIEKINAALDAFEKATKSELCILVVRSINGENARNHARRMRRKMTVSVKSSCILVIALADRHVELATAPAFAHIFTPDYTKKLLLNTFVPSIRDYNLCKGIVTTAEALRSSILQAPSVSHWPPWKRIGRTSKLLGWVACILICCTITIWSICSEPAFVTRCPQCGKPDSIQVTEMAPGEYSPGIIKKLRYDCLLCKHQWIVNDSGSSYDHGGSSWSPSEGGSYFDDGGSSSSSGDGGSSSGGDDGGSSSSDDGGGGADW